MPLLALLLAAATIPVAATQPTGPWVVDGEDNLCLLQRTYVVDGRSYTLAFQPLLDLPQMDMYVVVDDRSNTQYSGTYKVRVDPTAQEFSGRYYSVRATKSPKRFTRLAIDRTALDELKDGDTVHVKAKPIDLDLAIVRPDKARAALRVCTEALKKSWGVDPEMESRAVTTLDGNPGRYFGPASYPVEALRKGIYGRVIALLNVNTAGQVEHCRIVSSAGSALNDGTCKVAMQIRFKPARDAAGVPLSSTYLLPVRWVLPGSPR